MLSDKLLFASLIVGVSLVLQGLVPTLHIANQDGFWMYIAAIIFLIGSVISSGALLALTQSKCTSSSSSTKQAMFHVPLLALNSAAFFFFMLYAFVADVSTDHKAVQNAIFLLLCATGILVLISIAIVLIALSSKKNEKVSKKSDRKLDRKSDRKSDRNSDKNDN